MPLKAVFFDLGETLIDETRMWREWADYMGVSERDFTAALEQVIARGEHHHRAFELLQPGFDPRAAQLRRVADGTRYLFRPDDLYPDAKACLTALRKAGLFVGIAGNQPRDLLDSMHALGLDVDIIRTSEHLGFEKPSPKFFEALLAQTGFSATEAAYVGDRVDNDILPAKGVGMTTVFLKRGPWGRAHASQSAAADICVETLAELFDALQRIRKDEEARSQSTNRAQN